MNKKSNSEPQPGGRARKATQRDRSKEPFATQSVSLGGALIPNVDNIADVLEMIEAEADMGKDDG